MLDARRDDPVLFRVSHCIGASLQALLGGPHFGIVGRLTAFHCLPCGLHERRVDEGVHDEGERAWSADEQPASPDSPYEPQCPGGRCPCDLRTADEHAGQGQCQRGARAVEVHPAEGG